MDRKTFITREWLIAIVRCQPQSHNIDALFLSQRVVWFCCALLIYWTVASRTFVSAQPDVGGVRNDAAERFQDMEGSPRLPRESWQVIMDGDTRIGHSVTSWGPRNRQHGPLMELEWTQTTQLTIHRFGDLSAQEIHLTSIERLDGAVISCTAEHLDGDHRTSVTGTRKAGVFQFEIGDSDNMQSMEVEAPDSVRGFFALEQSLSNQPMRAGEVRHLDCWLPLSTAPVRLTLTAKQRETTRLLDRQSRLLRVEGSMRIAANGIMEFSCWQDERGQIPKMHIPATRQTTFTTTRERALQSTGGLTECRNDLGLTTLIPVPSSANPHSADQMEFLIRARQGSLRDVFPTTPTQSVRYVSDDEAFLLIRRLGPTADAREASISWKTGSDRSIEPAAETLQANHWIDCEDPAVLRLSQQAAGDERDRLAVARALAVTVGNWIEQKDFGRAFDTATTVARSRRGDCTEHAVLLAAVCRARQIPARIAFGLVYLNDRQSFAFHAWTEVWVDGRWIGLDATRDGNWLACGHIKVGDSDLARTTAPAAVLPLAMLFGKELSIEVVNE